MRIKVFASCILFLCQVAVSDAVGLVIFGAMPRLDPFISSISMIIIVSVVLAVEKALHYLHEFTHDTAYEEMVHAIQKELMIVGTMAFVFKIILQITTLPYDWVLALEFADVVVPITSFCVCAIGILLIMISLRVLKQWVRSYHLHLYEVLEHYYSIPNTWYNSPQWSFLPISTNNGLMEFRIYHSIFCECYNIKKEAFAFDQYVYRKYEKFLLKILHIDEYYWGIVLVLVFGNWGRFELGLDAHSCITDKRRALAGESIVDPVKAIECYAPAAVNNFIYAGIFLLLVCSILAIYCRVYELRLMGLRGISNNDDYALYLTSFEDAHKDDDAAAVAKDALSEKDLKKAVETAKSASQMKKQSEAKVSLLDIESSISRIKDSKVWKIVKGAYSRCVGKIKLSVEGFENLEEDEESTELKKELDKQAKLRQEAELARSSGSKVVGNNANNIVVPSRTVGKLMKRVRINRDKRAQIDQYIDDQSGTLKCRENFDDIFMFKKPDLFFGLVDVLIMPIAFYLALWITNYASLSKTLSNGVKSEEVRLQLLTVSPGIVCVLLYTYIVKVSALLSAITQVDNNTMLEIIEQTEGTRLLGQTLRQRILEKLHSMGDPEAQLKVLFDEIDDNGSNLLSRHEFTVFLNTLGIAFSRKKWSQIFVEIDLNNDDEISFKELFLFLFPENDVARLEEMKRLKYIGKVAKERAVELNAEIDEKKRAPLARGFTKQKMASDQITKVLTRELGEEEDIERGLEQEVLENRELLHVPNIEDIEEL